MRDFFYGFGCHVIFEHSVEMGGNPQVVMLVRNHCFYGFSGKRGPQCIVLVESFLVAVYGLESLVVRAYPQVIVRIREHRVHHK